MTIEMDINIVADDMEAVKLALHELLKGIDARAIGPTMCGYSEAWTPQEKKVAEINFNVLNVRPSQIPVAIGDK